MAPGRSLWPRIWALEDVLGSCFSKFKELATDGAVSAPQVAGLPAEVALAESDSYLVVLRRF